MRHKGGRDIRRIVDRVPLPDPWDVNALCEEVARLRGRPIRVIPDDAIGDKITGAACRMQEFDVIFYRATLSGIHRDHVVCHELGHLLAGHLDGREPYPLVDEDLSEAARTMLLRQCYYDEERERDAEAIAELIMRRVRQRVAGAPDRGGSSAARLLGSALR